MSNKLEKATSKLDFSELDRLRWNAEQALAWLNAREPLDDQFKEAAQARSALAIYHDALKRAAPELTRLARIGASHDWKPFETYPWGREVLYFVPSYESFSELLGRTVRHPARQIVMTLLMRQTFDGPEPTHWAELPASPPDKGQTE